MYLRSLSLLSPENSFLLVVDVQEKLMAGIDGGETALFNVRRLLDAARALSVGVVVSEQYPQGLGSTVKEILDAIPEGSPRLDKKSFSVCADEKLYQVLETRSVPKVVLCGVEGHICILQTAMDLMAMGKEVVLAVDASGSRSMEDFEIALRRMEASGIALSTTESIMFEWCNSAGHPQFTTISNLAKESP